MPSTYRSSRLRGWLVTALSLSYIPVALVGVVAMSVDVIVQLDRLAGRPPNAAEVTFADSVGPWWLVAVFALWVAGWIAFPLWLARVYSNLGTLGRTPRHSSAVAVVGALVM